MLHLCTRSYHAWSAHQRCSCSAASLAQPHFGDCTWRLAICPSGHPVALALQDFKAPGSQGKQYFLGLEAVLGGSGNPAYPGGQVRCRRRPPPPLAMPDPRLCMCA